MKILVIHNTAGGYSAVLDWLVLNGHDVKLIEIEKHDTFRRASKHKESIIAKNQKHFFKEIVKQIMRFKPDVIHVNSMLYAVLCSRYVTRIPLVLRFCGSDIRGKKLPSIAKLANKIVVSTDDLKEYGDVYNSPISTIFEYKGGRVLGTAVMVMYKRNVTIFDVEGATQWCEENGVSLVVINQDEKPIRFESMPHLLSRFEYYMEFKGLPDLSKLAREARGCGCKVIHNGKPKEVFPDATKPVEYLDLYMNLKNTKFSRMPLLTSLVTVKGILMFGWTLLHRLYYWSVGN